MDLFLDSSKIAEARRWRPVVTGITTNPSILLKEGGSVEELAQEFPDIPISVEATGDFITEAHQYASKIPNAVIKIPLLKPDKGDNMDIIYQLNKEGIKVNCTALFSLAQVMLAAKCGAYYVSVFAGRVDDEGGDFYSMIQDCVKFLDDEDLVDRMPCSLIVGSIRTVGNILEATRAGAHIVTVPPQFLEKMMIHQYSRLTVQQFEDDARKLKGG